MLAAATLPPPFIVQSVALVVAAAAIAYVCHRIGLVPIVGFLVAGVVIGPHALGWVSDLALVNAAAEIGVILLLFTIGIEFSLEKLARIKRLIFGCGGLQVALSSLATMGVLALAGVDWRAGLFTGFLVSLSSTAIVLKLLGDRGETGSPYGQTSLGVLIFQDLAIIVMVLLVPMLAGAGDSPASVVWALAKAGAIILLVLLVARRLMPPVLERVARTCSPELFLLTVIAICLGTAWLTSVAGVSLSLGAFLAGLLVSESRFSHHAFGEILPLQILFSAAFFVSVGMLLDVSFLARHLLPVIAVVIGVLVVKVVTTAVSARVLGQPLAVAAATGLTLAQIGEFSFVLDRAGQAVGLSPAGLGETGSQTFIAASVTLMVATPQLTTLASWLAGWHDRLPRVSETAVEEADASAGEARVAHVTQHVIVAGFGQAARLLVHVLAGSRIPFVITTLSPGGANDAEEAGLPVLRGDYARPHTLLAAGLTRARLLVVVDDEPAMAHRVLAVARSIAPEVRLVARTRYGSEGASLRAAGADLVVTEELESVVQVFAEIMRVYRVEPAEIERHAATIRDRGYAALLDLEGDRPAVDCSIDGACGPARSANLSEAAMGSRERTDIDPQQSVTLVPSEGTCGHVAQLHAVHPSARGCEDCLKTGDTWVHLRVCMTCGHVGCCDSSPNTHATRHFHATAHPIVRSLERGEQWGWCYVDEVML